MPTHPDANTSQALNITFAGVAVFLTLAVCLRLRYYVRRYVAAQDALHAAAAPSSRHGGAGPARAATPSPHAPASRRPPRGRTRREEEREVEMQLAGDSGEEEEEEEEERVPRPRKKKAGKEILLKGSVRS
jgi:hypothetical protein